MRARDILLLLAVGNATVTCGGVPAPRNALPAASAVGSDGYGGWIVARRGAAELAGELIAAHDDSLWILNSAGLHGHARGSFTGAKVVTFDPKTAALNVWATLGTLATISNGGFLIFTAPAWLITSAIIIPAAGKQAALDWQPFMPLSGIAPYARFPAGMPADLDRASLQLPPRMRK